MRLVAVELEDVSGDGIGPAIVDLQGLTVAIGRNGVGKTLVLEGIEAVLGYRSQLERGGLLGDPPIPYGSVIVSIGEADWGWIRAEFADGLSSNGGDPFSEFASPTHFYELGDEEQPNADEPQSLEQFAQLLRAAFAEGLQRADPGSVADCFDQLVPDESLLLSIGVFPGANVWMSRPLAMAPELIALASELSPHADPDSLAALVLDRIVNPPDHVGLLHIGSLPEDRDPNLLARLPSPTRLTDRVEDPWSAVNDSIWRLPAARGWLVRDESGGLVPSPVVGERLDQINDLANRLTPDFVQEAGRIVVRPPDPAAFRSEPLRPVVALEGEERGPLEFDLLGAGTRRWVGIAVAEACRRLDPGWSERSPIYLIDEPEMHLHPIAQADVRAWIDDRVDEGATAVVATHSPVFMASRHGTTSYLALTRVGGVLRGADISGTTLEVLTTDFRKTIGLDPAAAFQVVRGFLIVEGSHDRDVVKHFFGSELAAACVEVVPLHGHKKAPAVIDAHLLRWAGKPVVILFDEVSASAADAANYGATLDMKAASSEERAAFRLAQELSQDQEAVASRVVPLPLPDIIAVLPMSAVRRAYPECHEVEWHQINAGWRERLVTEANPPGGFKRYALDRLKLRQVGADDFVHRTLVSAGPSDRPGPEVARAVSESLAFLTAAR